MQFDVTPASGMLPVETAGMPAPTASLDVGLHPQPVSAEEKGGLASATVFVKYTAPGYGQAGSAARGRLVVQTEDASWSWAVLGLQPPYLPPDKSCMKSHLLDPVPSKHGGR